MRFNILRIGDKPNRSECIEAPKSNAENKKVMEERNLKHPALYYTPVPRGAGQVKGEILGAGNIVLPSFRPTALNIWLQ